MVLNLGCVEKSFMVGAGLQDTAVRHADKFVRRALVLQQLVITMHALRAVW